MTGAEDRDPLCVHLGHSRFGIVTSVGPAGAHAACNVCTDPECIEDAIAWCSEITGQPAHHRPDPLDHPTLF